MSQKQLNKQYISPDFIKFDVRTMTLVDYDKLESVSTPDLGEHYWELKQQILGERFEWTQDVNECFNEISKFVIKGVKL